MKTNVPTIVSKHIDNKCTCVIQCEHQSNKMIATTTMFRNKATTGSQVHEKISSAHPNKRIVCTMCPSPTWAKNPIIHEDYSLKKQCRSHTGLRKSLGIYGCARCGFLALELPDVAALPLAAQIFRWRRWLCQGGHSPAAKLPGISASAQVFL